MGRRGGGRRGILNKVQIRENPKGGWMKKSKKTAKISAKQNVENCPKPRQTARNSWKLFLHLFYLPTWTLFDKSAVSRWIRGNPIFSG